MKTTLSLEHQLFLGVALSVIPLLSFLMLGVVCFQWKKRKKSGFSWGKQVRGYPLTWGEFGQLMGLLLLAYSQFIFIGLGLERFKALQTNTRKVVYTIVCQTILYLVFLGLTGWFLKRKGETWNHAFGFRSSGFKNVFVSAVVSLSAILFPLQLLAWWTRYLFHIFQWPIEPQPIIQLLLETHHLWFRIGLAAMAVLGAPLAEEVLFRGLLYPCLKQRVGFVHAVWISAALFAAFHHHASSTLPLFGLGIAFALLYEWCGNLGAPILFHAGFNGLSLSMLFLVKDHLLY